MAVGGDNRIITFEYAKEYYDFFKKQTIPNSKECMTKQDVNDYIQVNPSFITAYSTNRLVPRFRVVGQLQNYSSLCYYFNDAVYTLARQSDGKIIVGGAFTKHKDTTCNRIVRFNTDGTIDNTFQTNIGVGFDGGGLQDTSIPTSVNKILIQSDGKILVGGSFVRCNTQTYYSLVRLNSNGTIDTSFNTGYNLMLYHGGGSEVTGTVEDMIILNNKLYVIGWFTDINPNVSYTSDGTSVFNLSNGSKDYSVTPPLIIGNAFNPGRIVLNHLNEIYYMTWQSINKRNSDLTLARAYNVPSGHKIFDMIFDSSSSSIIIGGSFTSFDGVGAINISRILSNGNIDTTFTTNYHNTVPNSTRIILCLKATNTGKIYVYQSVSSGRKTISGEIPTETETGGSLIRINSDGTYDSSFSPVVFPIVPNRGDERHNFFINDILISTEKIYVGGRFIHTDSSIKNGNMLKTDVAGNINCTADITYMYINNYYNNPCMISYEIYQGSDNIIYVSDSGFMLPITNYPNSWYQFNTVIDSNTYEWRKYNSSLIQIGTETSPCGVQ